MYKVCCGVAKIYEGLCTLFSSLIICVVFPSLKAKVIMVKDHEDWNTTTQHHIFIILMTGTLGPYPIPIPWEKLANIEIPCRKSMKYWYRIYDQSRLLKVSCCNHLVCLFITTINLSHWEKTWEDLDLIRTTI